MILVLPEPVHQSNGQGKEGGGGPKSLNRTHYTDSRSSVRGQCRNGIENGDFKLRILGN